MHAGIDRLKRITAHRVSLLLALVLASCQPGLPPSPITTPQVLVVQASTALQPIQPLFKTCTAEQENTALVMARASSEMNTPSSDISLRWGLNTQPPGFAAVLGFEELVLVVNPQNPVSQLSQDQVKAIWAGTLTKWPGDKKAGEIQAWVYPANEDIQQIFEHTLLSDFAPVKNTVYIAADPSAMIEAVSSGHGATGFLPRRWLTQQVKQISIEGIPPNSLRQPILALTQSQPEGLVKSWLLCLQDNLGK
jgi:DNA-binding transcriptional LysR family regulator